MGVYVSQSSLAQAKISLPEYSAQAQISLPEYSGLSPKLPARVLWLRSKSLSQSTLPQALISLPEFSGLSPKLPPRLLWLRPKSLSQSTLAQVKTCCQSTLAHAKDLRAWLRPKSLSQSTLGGGYEPLPEYSGRALQSEDYHLFHLINLELT